MDQWWLTGRSLTPLFTLLLAACGASQPARGPTGRLVPVEVEDSDCRTAPTVMIRVTIEEETLRATALWNGCQVVASSPQEWLFTGEGDTSRPSFRELTGGSIESTVFRTLGGSNLLALSELVPLPPVEEASVEVRWEVQDREGFRFATTLTDRFDVAQEVTFAELQDAQCVIGDLGESRISSPVGLDRVLSVGRFGFDPRWLAAELAIVRTQVDTLVGGIDRNRFTTILVNQDVSSNSMPTFSPIPHGLIVAISETASLDAALRLALAQVFARRWIGNVLRLEGDVGFFELGMSRFVAVTVLRELSLLAPQDLAREESQLAWIVATVKTSDAPNASVLSAGARGYFWARATQRLLASGRVALSGLLRSLLATAFETGEPLSFAVIEEREKDWLAGESLPPDDFLQGALPAPADDTCVHPRRAVLQSWEMGFARTTTDPPSVGEVTARSRAARAGLRTGDVLIEETVVPFEPRSEVRLRVRRQDATVDLVYLPLGDRTPGWEFRADSTEDCR